MFGKIRSPTVGSIDLRLSFVWSRLTASAELSPCHTTVDIVLKIDSTSTTLE